MNEKETEGGEKTLASIVHRIAGLLSHGGGILTTGDVASLRRMDPHRIDSPGFYKLAAAVLDQDLHGDTETRWAALMVGLAHLGDLNRPGARLGHALVEAGLSELRFSRLIRADAERLLDEIPAIARFLAAKGVAADFADAAYLLLSAGRKDEETTRRHLARDYYGALERAKTSNP